jgi:hypothetical protein
MVSDFWNMIGWAVMEGLIELDLVRSRFGPAVDVWEKLRAIEVLLRKERIIKFHEPDLDDEDAERLAVQFVENHQPAGWLYQKWKKRGSLVISGVRNYLIFKQIRHILTGRDGCVEINA